LIEVEVSSGKIMKGIVSIDQARILKYIADVI
jgi:hypothetical protein